MRLLKNDIGIYWDSIIPSGRFDELGSGVINVNHYLPLYAKEAKPEFREDNSTFMTLLPLATGIFIDEASEETTQKTPQKTTLKPTQKTEERILESLRQKPELSRKQLSAELGDITEDGVKYHLDKMKKRGIIRRVGSARGGHWEVIDHT